LFDGTIACDHLVVCMALSYGFCCSRDTDLRIAFSSLFGNRTAMIDSYTFEGSAVHSHHK
jgi:hypothetical protein